MLFRSLSLGIDEGSVLVSIVDENRKININNIPQEKKGGKTDTEKVFQRYLSSLLEIDKEDDTIIDILNNIQDWTDEDDESVTAEDAEQSYYESLDPPYPCKNGPLDTISELRLIKGMIEEKIIEKIEGLSEEGTIIQLNLMRDLTVYPVNGGGKININTAESQVIEALCDDADDVMVNDIIARREDEPFENINEAMQFIGCNIMDMIGKTSSYYSVDATGEVNGIRKRIVAVLNKDTDKIKIVYWRVE